MEIRLTHIEVGELVKGYFDKQEEGVYGYDNKLNIRPPYQREFVYNEKQRKLVIDTILKGFPLNTMYWVDNGEEKYELLDGQQRTMSICQFVQGEFSIKYNGVEMYYYNLPFEIRRKILDYKLMIYICQGETTERLDWFRTINISGEKLTDQELLNINFIGSWLSDAKIKFSKTNCVAYKLGQKYVKGSPIRQEYLEVVLDWISEGDIVGYMSKHQNDVNANELWLYFNSVIEWVKTTFGEKNYRSEMKGLNWGKLYNLYHTKTYDIEYIEKSGKLLGSPPFQLETRYYLLRFHNHYHRIGIIRQTCKRSQWTFQLHFGMFLQPFLNILYFQDTYKSTFFRTAYRMKRRKSCQIVCETFFGRIHHYRFIRFPIKPVVHRDIIVKVLCALEINQIGRFKNISNYQFFFVAFLLSTFRFGEMSFAKVENTIRFQFLTLHLINGITECFMKIEVVPYCP